MTSTTKFIDGRWRVVDAETLKPVLGRYGTPADGVGHESPQKAQSQAEKIDAAVKKRKEHNAT